ncbi:hypothetical protein K443DRAFT_133066 [Laccaria amethystina LaAM-08-1]|uniref:Unplaced genomic scaffold K443scaffold_112, whole genome shotgun sequence n=1 Tax=Laccaria amethystina LaAM-08-1 TaxID=1095629 RepID=A0A0C9XU83_9AGAR|nr:hypothetical protein K443DRAFT_133066 [Laccaria amethystina LaAM-08-1]
MEVLRGVERGSYIWGRSVHNVRIERLWRDVMLGFGQKWKDFFQNLEVHDQLNHNLNSHIWLLHHLPKDMFVFRMMENGMQGLGHHEVDNIHLPQEQIQEYGIDWAAHDEPAIQHHHDAHNRTDELAHNLFLTHQPQHLSHVQVDAPDCPFASNEELRQLPYYDDHDMASHRLLWISALDTCTQMFSVFHIE